MEFKHSIPHPDESLSDIANSAIQVASLAGQLAIEERKIVFNTDGRPENVAEHSSMLAIVAPALADKFFPGLNADRVARLCSIHDIVEVYVGDTATYDISEQGFQEKEARERLGLKQLKLEYAAFPKMVNVIDEYEAQETPEARFVRIVDKLMPLLVYFNDNGAGLRSIDFKAEEVRSNSIERTEKFSREFPEFMTIVNLRAELAEQVAKMIDK